MYDRYIKILTDEIIILFGMSFGLKYKLLDEKFNTYYFDTIFDIYNIIDRLFSLFDFNEIKSEGNSKPIDKEIRDRIKEYFIKNGIMFDGNEPNAQPEKSLAEYISKFDYNDPLRKDLVNLFKKYGVFNKRKLEELAKLRQEPLYIKIMGEYALYSLPSIIGESFVSPLDYHIGYFFYYPSMTQERFENDVSDYGTHLMEQLQLSIIDENKLDCFMTMLGYLYNYYYLCRSGGQIPIRPISQTKYEEMKRRIRKYENDGTYFELNNKQKTDDIKRVDNCILSNYLDVLMGRPVESDGRYKNILPDPPKIKSYPKPGQINVT